MKKVILFSVLAVSAMVSNAQTMFGVQAGANFASIQSKESGIKYSSDSKAGLIIGALADVDFGNSISFRPELNFIQKGGKIEMSTSGGGATFSQKFKSTYNYIQLSPNFVYNIAAGSGKIFVGIGPEFSFGVSGKNKGTSTSTILGTTTSTSDDSDIKFDGKKDATDDKEHLNAFDFGGNILGGYKFGPSAFVSVGYTMGFANIVPGGNDDASVKNRGFNVKVGYMFGGK